MSNTKQRGGKRPNSGNKPKYGEPTTTIAFRVPISRKEHVKMIVNTLLDEWKLNQLQLQLKEIIN